MGATGPCKYCGDYPHHCAYKNGCPVKARYINEVDEDVPVVRKNDRKKNGTIGAVFYKDGKRYEYNKNGIRREVPTR